jgi:hypothetical protein
MSGKLEAAAMELAQTAEFKGVIYELNFVKNELDTNDKDFAEKVAKITGLDFFGNYVGYKYQWCVSEHGLPF